MNFYDYKLGRATYCGKCNHARSMHPRGMGSSHAWGRYVRKKTCSDTVLGKRNLPSSIPCKCTRRQPEICV